MGKCSHRLLILRGKGQLSRPYYSFVSCEWLSPQDHHLGVCWNILVNTSTTFSLSACSFSSSGFCWQSLQTFQISPKSPGLKAGLLPIIQNAWHGETEAVFLLQCGHPISLPMLICPFIATETSSLALCWLSISPHQDLLPQVEEMPEY